mgnify:CR=1 FL=1
MLNIPNHIAIVMDGNRRWAKKCRIETLLGHDKGAETLLDITKSCADVRVNWLTVFAGVGLFPVAHAGVSGSRREIPAPFNIKITPVGGIETS